MLGVTVSSRAMSLASGTTRLRGVGAVSPILGAQSVGDDHGSPPIHIALRSGARMEWHPSLGRGIEESLQGAWANPPTQALRGAKLTIRNFCDDAVICYCDKWLCVDAPTYFGGSSLAVNWRESCTNHGLKYLY